MGQPVECLVDTGATISVLTVDTVLQLNLQDVVQPTNKCFISASAHLVHSQGELPQLPINIGGVHCHVNFYIAPKGGYQLLLGMDVLMPRKAALDFNDSTMRLAKRLLMINVFQCKRVPMDIRRVCKSPMNWILRSHTAISPVWENFWRAMPPRRPQELTLEEEQDADDKGNEAEDDDTSLP